VQICYQISLYSNFMRTFYSDLKPHTFWCKSCISVLGVRGIKSCISVLGVRGIKSCICVLGVRGIKSCICVLGVRGINFTFVFWNCSDSKLFFIFHFISMFTFYSDQKSNYFNNYPIFGKNEFTTFFLYKCDAVIDAIAHLLDPKQNLSKKLVF
jgi:hypothetical protein